jgi:hypothetical protein
MKDSEDKSNIIQLIKRIIERIEPLNISNKEEAIKILLKDFINLNNKKNNIIILDDLILITDPDELNEWINKKRGENNSKNQ